MNRKKIISLIIIFIIIISVSALLFRNTCTPKRNNVVMIVSDALRRDVLACYRGGAKTPNIDWLAENGVLFERAYSTSPSTIPSAVGLFTSNYPISYTSKLIASWDVPLVDENEVLLAEILRKKGYDVRMDVENPLALGRNNMQGFEEIKPFNELTKNEHMYIENITGITSEEDYCRKMYGVLNFLFNKPKDKHFFILKWFMDPHSPYNPPNKFKQEIKVDLSKLATRRQFYSNLLFVGTPLIKKWSNYDQSYLKKLYDKEIESVDERVGFILKALKHKDLLDNTYIVFTADHGELFGEHGEWSHGQNYYEELVHIPLIITGPGISQGKRIKRIVSLLDIMETLKDLLEVQCPNNSQGNSFKNLLVWNPIKSFLFSVENNNFTYFANANLKSKYQDALLENNYKLIFLKDNTNELYDLTFDQDESNDISEKYPKLVNRMTKKIIEIREENRIRKKDRMGKEGELKEKVDKELIEQLKSLGYIN